MLKKVKKTILKPDPKPDPHQNWMGLSWVILPPVSFESVQLFLCNLA